MSKFDELKKLAEAATPGPWRTGQFPKEICGPTDVVVNNEYGLYAILIGNTNFPADAKNNAAYSAAANPAVILELLAIQAPLVEALENIAKPANAGCGCHFPCRCDSEGAEAINAVSMRSEAQEALAAYYAATGAQP